MVNRIFGYLSIMLFGQYVLMLAGDGSLAYYIHPRYFVVTTLAAVVCLIAGLAGMLYELYLANKSAKHAESKPKSPSFTDSAKFLYLQIKHLTTHKMSLQLIWGLLVISAFVIPPTTLSARSASQRVSTTNVLTSEQITAVSQFVNNRANYGIAEWTSELNREPDLSKYVGEKVNLDGFIFRAPDQTKGQFTIARFVVRCCVVDATPVGIKVLFDWEGDFRESDWVQVSGEFVLVEHNSRQVLAIQADKLEKKEKPKITYIY